MENLTELSIEQLNELLTSVKEEISKRQTPKDARVLFDPADSFERYNGGWTKIVTGIDKKFANGYSIVGGFMPNGGKKEWYETTKLYLDCGIGGSRKNQRKYYTLFKVNEDGTVNELAKTTSNNWAVDLWDTIEKTLNA